MDVRLGGNDAFHAILGKTAKLSKLLARAANTRRQQLQANATTWPAFALFERQAFSASATSESRRVGGHPAWLLAIENLFATIDAMLLPRFSIRLILGFTAVCAIVAYVGAHAVEGKAWAMGVIASVGFLVAATFCYVGLFLLGWIISSVFGLVRVPDRPHSPFAGASPPPQIIEPPQDSL